MSRKPIETASSQYVLVRSASPMEKSTGAVCWRASVPWLFLPAARAGTGIESSGSVSPGLGFLIMSTRGSPRQSRRIPEKTDARRQLSLNTIQATMGVTMNPPMAEPLIASDIASPRRRLNH